MSVAIRDFPWYSSNLSLAQPTYSIIIPAYNESRRIGSTLQRVVEHLREQKWSAELLVVDDGSRDDTPEIIERFAATGTVPFPPEMRSPAAHAKFLTEQFDFYAKMFAAANVKKEEAK